MDDAQYKLILDHIADGVSFSDRQGRISFWSKGAEAMTGFAPGEILGRDCHENVFCRLDDDGARQCDQDCRLARGQGNDAGEDIYVRHKKGHLVPVRLKSEPVRGADGEIEGMVEVFIDRTEHAACLERVEELTRETLHDPLTGVGNRRYAEITLNSRFDEAHRYGWPFGVLFVDIDHFKRVNDTLGHEVGDEVLRMVAATLASNLRSFDFVGRWGGEEFLVVMPNVDSLETVSLLAERFRKLIAASSSPLIGGGSLSVTVSIGATMVRTEENLDDLLRRVDDLMYASKQAGRDCVTTDESDTCSRAGRKTGQRRA